MSMEVPGEAPLAKEKGVSKVLVKYINYVSVKQLLLQLDHENPMQKQFLEDFAHTHSLEDPHQFVVELLREHRDLAERLMDVQEIVAGQFQFKLLPEYVNAVMMDSKLDLYRAHLASRISGWPDVTVADAHADD
eukprot:CAMPEP_0196653748 /NCGR_PEP_ID=MMETSP1086-20130531/3391_1 /TAXON_ID=77921 /ORGANISM="Cyanoptyche  gloeocystis , Strain SAG4.97" /LENGTH=133 /DNA_ID=CAMNT_0041985093 /DNA_START=399 /DNA_END=800 /DNA_ORIENTATION=+